MDFRILGPLGIRIGGSQLALGNSREQKILAALLLNANHVVLLDRLVDVVWGDRPPGGAGKLIRNRVSVLRAQLANLGAPADRIVTEGAGYRLRVGPGELDAHVFADRLARARQLADASQLAGAADELRQALALWRGPALAGIDSAALEAPASRLNEQRLAALEDCLEYELALGRGPKLVAELCAAVTEHPLREHLRAQLMLALYQSWRRSEALEVYRQGRRHLVEELGLEPGPQLQEMQQAIINDDPALTRVRPATRTEGRAPAQLPAQVPDFTGRAEELRYLDGLLSELRAGKATTVIVSAIGGTAGVGKTALAVHWAHRARADFPDGQLHVNLRGYASGAPMRLIDALTQFLRALGVAADQVPVDVDEAAALYRTLMAGRRMLVVLDNAASADQVRPLLPGSPGCLVLVTSRESLTGLVAREGARVLNLDVLTPAEAYLLLGRILGADRVGTEPEAVERLARLCAHLPLALRIAAAFLTARPRRSIASYVTELEDGDAVSALSADGDERNAVQAAFDLSYRKLAADCQLMFRRLGLLQGPSVTPAALAALADASPADALRTLDRLAAAHLVSEVADGRFSFHDLLRQYAGQRALAEDSEIDRQAASCRLLDWYLHMVDAATRTLYPEILRLPGALGAPLPTFDDSSQALAWLDAELGNLVTAINHAAEFGPRRPAWMLADMLRGYFHLRMYTADWLSVAQAGLTAAGLDGEVAAQAAAQLSLGDLYWRLSRYPDAITDYALAAALAEKAGWLHGQCAILGNLGNVYQQSGQLDQAAAHYRRALALAQQTGWVAGQAANLENLGAAYWELGRLEDAYEHSSQAVAICRQTGSRFAQGVALTGLGEVCHALGRPTEASGHLTLALKLHREVGNRGGEAETCRLLGAIDRDNGDLDSALDRAQAALALAREAGDRRYEADALNTVATIQRMLGRRQLAVAGHRQALALAREIGNRYPEVEALIGLAIVHRELGAPDARLSHEAVNAARQVGYRLLEERALATLAGVDLDQGQPLRALPSGGRDEQVPGSDEQAYGGLPALRTDGTQCLGDLQQSGVFVVGRLRGAGDGDADTV